MHRMSVFAILLSLLFALSAGCDIAPDREGLIDPATFDGDGDGVPVGYECDDSNGASAALCGVGDACQYNQQCIGNGACVDDACKCAGNWLGETCETCPENWGGRRL